MGAGASAYEGSSEDIPKDIEEVYEQCEEIKRNIAVKDAQFIHAQSIHNWKDHSHLIALLSERTKSQLVSVAKIFPEHDGEGLNVNSDANDCQDTKMLELKLYNMLGRTQYAEFMKDCVMRPESVDLELLSDTLNYLGTNENLLAEIFCTLGSDELQRLSSLYEYENKVKLIDKIMKKTKMDSPFQKFLCLVLTERRKADNEDAMVETDVFPLVEALHDSGLGNNQPRDDDRIFDILVKASRSDCQQIETVYMNTYGKDFHDAIREKYKGSMALALILWTEGHINDAIAQRIEHNLENVVLKSTDANGEMSKSLTDVRRLVHIIARYDHWQLELIRQSYQKIFSKDMLSVIEAKLSGKCKKAVIAWLTNNKTCDGGFENQVWKILRDNSADNYSSILNDEEKKSELRHLLKSQYDHLVTYSEKHHIHLAPTITRKNASEHNTAVNNNPGLSYDEKFNLVQDYLLEMIKIEDYDNSGVLDSNDLWLILNDMELGYTEEEMEAFSSWIDVDGDGQIEYNEILHELSDDIIRVIEDVGQLTIPEKLADLRRQREDRFKELHISLNEAGHVVSSSAPPLPPTLMEYLHDTFNEVDADKSGTLNYRELNNILHTVLAYSEGDKEILNIEWDKDYDGAVSWDEASKAFSDIFNKYVNSKNDYWIALVDRSNGQFFWYNVRDSNSFWMTEEDQAKYQARSHEEHMIPTKIPRKTHSYSSSTGSETDISSYQAMRRLQKEKFEAIKNKTS